MNRNLLALALAGIVAGPAMAQQPPQPQQLTPPNTPVQFAAVYLVPYATSQPPLGVPLVAETVVTVGVNASSPNPCQIQVEWVDWNGGAAGVSGPFLVPPDFTFEFTTHNMPPPPPAWPLGQLNVFRSQAAPFEGHAKVHSSCGTGRRLRVNAQTVSTNLASQVSKYIHTKVTKIPGNVGD